VIDTFPGLMPSPVIPVGIFIVGRLFQPNPTDRAYV